MSLGHHVVPGSAAASRFWGLVALAPAPNTVTRHVTLRRRKVRSYSPDVLHSDLFLSLAEGLSVQPIWETA
jgi:hypothetical protein